MERVARLEFATSFWARMSAPAAGHPQPAVFALQSLDARFFVDGENHGVGGWSQIKSNDAGAIRRTTSGGACGRIPLEHSEQPLAQAADIAADRRASNY